MDVQAKPPSSGAADQGRPAGLSHRRLLGGVLGIAIATAFALLQGPRPDALGSPTPLEAFLRPLEINAALRLPVVDATLSAICADAAGASLWIAGSGGLLLHSRDGGRSWQRQDLSGRLGSAGPAAARTAWLQRVLPIPLALAGEPQPYADPADTKKQSKNLRTLAVDPKQAFSNAAAAPAPQAEADPATADYHAIACGADGEVWLAGAGGLILQGREPGAPWRVQRVGSGSRWRGLSFHDARSGWAVSEDGRVARTRDGGANWQLLPAAGARVLHAVSTLDAQSALAAGEGLALLQDDSLQWLERSADAAMRWTGLARDRLGTTWLAGDDGSVLRRGSAAEARARRFVPEPGLALHAIAGAASGDALQFEALWVAGARGRIRKTLQPQAADPSWQTQDLAEPFELRAIHAADARRAWVIGSGGALFRTDDGGARWYAQTRPTGLATAGQRYWRLPAPWYYVAVPALWLWAVSRSARRRKRGADAEASVADLLISDRPLQLGDPDPMNLGEIARGLSRFLRNERTEPPLTLAITGEWGSGKSSLMNLLRQDLQARGFRPVWFNAWHHQKGEQLLPSLFAAISAQGIPPPLTVAGLNFRLNLLVRRGWKHGFVTALMLLLLAALLVYVARRPDEVRNLTGWLSILDSAESADAGLAAMLDALIRGGLVLPPLVAFWRGMRAFRIKPAALISSLGESGSGLLQQQQPAARARFAAEFEDMTGALGEYRLALFIDDLDRCEAEHVVEVLEAVNFLTSSGRCFVVLGMDEKWVQTCVGLKYAEIASERALLENARGDGAAQRRTFAEHYLQKLVNIEVPVPLLEEEASRALLAPAPLPPPGWAQRGARLAWSHAPWLLVLVPLWLGSVLGGWLSRESAPGLPAAFTALEVDAPARSGNVLASDPAQASVLPAGSLPLRFEPARSADSWPQLLVATLAFTLVVVLLRLLARQQALTHDSESFHAALRLWHPWVLSRQRTPRAIKRFVNRVRYIAMRSRQERETRAWPERAAQWLGFAGRPPPATPSRIALPEPTLVALSAIHELLPESLAQPPDRGAFEEQVLLHLDRHLAAQLREGTPDPQLATALVELRAALNAHGGAFPGQWPPNAALVEEFLRVLAVTTVR